MTTKIFEIISECYNMFTSQTANPPTEVILSYKAYKDLILEIHGEEDATTFMGMKLIPEKFMSNDSDMIIFKNCNHIGIYSYGMLNILESTLWKLDYPYRLKDEK